MSMGTDALETTADRDANLQSNQAHLLGCMEAKEKLTLMLGKSS